MSLKTFEVDADAGIAEPTGTPLFPDLWYYRTLELLSALITGQAASTGDEEEE